MAMLRGVDTAQDDVCLSSSSPKPASHGARAAPKHKPAPARPVSTHVSGSAHIRDMLQSLQTAEDRAFESSAVLEHSRSSPLVQPAPFPSMLQPASVPEGQTSTNEDIEVEELPRRLQAIILPDASQKLDLKELSNTPADEDPEDKALDSEAPQHEAPVAKEEGEEVEVEAEEVAGSVIKVSQESANVSVPEGAAAAATAGERNEARAQVHGGRQAESDVGWQQVPLQGDTQEEGKIYLLGRVCMCVPWYTPHTS